MSHSSPAAFKSFSLSLTFSTFVMRCLWISAFILLCIRYAFWMYRLFNIFWKVFSLIPSDNFSAPFFVYWPLVLFLYICSAFSTASYFSEPPFTSLHYCFSLFFRLHNIYGSVFKFIKLFFHKVFGIASDPRKAPPKCLPVGLSCNLASLQFVLYLQ